MQHCLHTDLESIETIQSNWYESHGKDRMYRTRMRLEYNK